MVVTGGANGIGRAAVLRFLAEDASVVAADYNAGAGASLADELDDKRLRFARTDVSVEDDVATCIATAVEEFGHLDVMVNNAGVGGAFGPITEIEAGDWDWTFGVLAARRLPRDQARGAHVQGAGLRRHHRRSLACAPARGRLRTARPRRASSASRAPPRSSSPPTASA